MQLRVVLQVALVVMVAACSVGARADDAEIVALIGKGDARESAAADWKPAVVKQKLVGGSFVRTREQSQMALLLKDNTQIRLNQQSILNIKSIGKGSESTKLELPQGRAWSQAKARGADVAAQKRPIVEVATPSAVAGIRGTDWEIVVEPDGTSTITVLSGEVDFYNDHGRVVVLPNEQARAVKGKAPVKIFLSTAAERVQWVTSYRPQPRRWVPGPTGALAGIVKNIEEAEYAPALEALAKDKTLAPLPAALLSADMQLFLGQPAQAISILTPHAADGNGDSMAAALLGRAQLIAGRISDAARVLGNAGMKHASHIEVLLARAELGRVQGDANAVRAASMRVIEIDPKNAEAWYMIGRIETEREYAKAAREALNRAIELRPDGPGFKGELGTLETFANNFPEADAAFRGALEQSPDDYVALTGLGVLQLKRGETEAALQSFLKAGVIEPRYARAWFFTGVAYYQLGEHARALEAFEKAAALDDKDPLPHLMRSLAYYDALELGLAIEAARAAQVRMPFLKSLNQVLNDQKGSANVGSALAAFGLEEWSQAYAYDSYNPYWAGSHLFLADRFPGTFNKNSELFMGYLSDPSVFGASNRYSSLVPVPGHYGSIGVTGGRDYITDIGLNLAVNGYSVSSVPFSYFLGYDRTRGDSSINRTDADGRMEATGDNFVFGVGLRPTHELGFFAFGNVTKFDGKLEDRASGLVNDDFKTEFQRYDAGLNYKFTPTNQAWFKVGKGTDKLPVSGVFFSQDVADTLNDAFNTGIFRPNGRLITFNSETSQSDVQLRHTFDVDGGVQLTWGLEYANEEKPFVMNLEFLPLRIHLRQDNQVESRSAYVSGKFRLAANLDAQLDLHYQETKSTFTTDQALEVVNIVTVPLPLRTGGQSEHEWNPRLGLKWRPTASQTVRLAAQSWRKPASVNTLSPIDTVGIALDDQIEQVGGRLRRARLQHEIQWDSATFFQWYLDTKRVKNLDDPGGGIVADLELEQLEKLRSRRRVYALRADYLEDTPEFGSGRADLLGLSFNRLLSRHYTLAARYVYADTENTTPGLNGRALPFHPKHYFNVGLNWQPRKRVVVGPMATYRSSRYRDDANLEPLDSGWAFGLFAYWESDDKKVSLSGFIDQIHSDKGSSIYRHPIGQLQAIFRF